MLNAMMLGDKITEARKSKNLSQAELAKLLTVSPQAVSKWERGESIPDIITFNRMAELLSVDLNYFSENFESAAKPEARPAQIPPPTTNTAAASKGWDMSSGNWKDGDFSGLSNLKNRFGSANIMNCLFVKSDLAGIELKSNNIVGCDFTGSDMSGCRLDSTNIQRNRFNACNLSKAALKSCHIEDSDFTGADMRGAYCKSCEFAGAQVSGVLFENAEFENVYFLNMTFGGLISGCSFVGCTFKKVEFKDALLKNTFFKNNDVRKMKFTDCKADRLTYSFLKSGGADVTGIEITEA